jgi:hypothetical protein
MSPRDRLLSAEDCVIEPYEAALHEIQPRRLFVCIETAESTILLRRDVIGRKAKHSDERAHIAHALTLLTLLKKYCLGFG